MLLAGGGLGVTLFVALLLVAATAWAAAGWSPQSSGTTNGLAAVAFANSSDGWAVGAAGTILATSDGGTTWSTQSAPSGITQNLSAVAFANAERGWIAGAGGTVLATLSAGLPDVTAPVTTAGGLQVDGHSGWRNKAQTVTLKSYDNGSGVAATYFVLDGGAPQTYSGPFSVATAGSHSMTYWSVDAVGNAEAKRTGYVNIDTRRPVCVATANVAARPGTLVRFRFRIRDLAPTCGKAAVTIRIYRGRAVVKTIRLIGVPVNSRRHYDYRVNLAHGSYTWVVTATDLAGNAQAKVGRKTLRVVTWVIHNTADVQRCLAALHYLPHGAVTGVDDYRTQQALMAFQAWNGLTRDGIDGRRTRAKLEVATAPTPRRESATGHYAEVFRSLGVLLCVNNGKLVRVVHCSTGRPSLPTPAGRFSIYLKSLDWWSTKYLDWMPFASFFSGGDAIHGFPDVPAYPASHGCVRISMPEAPWVYTFLYYGAAVFVF
jgi:lipoprotein-anchoring transpeptidase ErfK/SrfK